MSESTPPRRFPRGVYDRGSDPDTRFSLANERTYLAWMRTALAVVAGSVAAHTPALGLSAGLSWGLSLWLLAVGAVCIWQACARWCRVESALRTGGPMPGFGGAITLAVGATGLVLIVLVGSTAAHLTRT